MLYILLVYYTYKMSVTVDISEDLCKPTNAEIEMVKPYCRCQKCRTSRFNPYRNLICGCCVGCLYSDRFSISVYNDAVKYKEKKSRRKSWFGFPFLPSSVE